MRRGDLVTVSVGGDFGKPRPVLVIQADEFAETATTTVPLLSGTLIEAPLLRIPVEPTPGNGLRKESQVMIDKTMTVRRDKLGSPFGRLDDTTLLSVNRALALFLGIVR